MLQNLFPRAHKKFQALPLLGAIADGFDDSLANSGYTESSRRDAMRMLKRADGCCDAVMRLAWPTCRTPRSTLAGVN